MPKGGRVNTQPEMNGRSRNSFSSPSAIAPIFAASWTQRAPSIPPVICLVVFLMVVAHVYQSLNLPGTSWGVTSPPLTRMFSSWSAMRVKAARSSLVAGRFCRLWGSMTFTAMVMQARAGSCFSKVTSCFGSRPKRATSLRFGTDSMAASTNRVGIRTTFPSPISAPFCDIRSRASSWGRRMPISSKICRDCS